MEEEGIVGLCPIDEPLHSAHDVSLSGLLGWIRRIVRQHDNVFFFISIVPWKSNGSVNSSCVSNRYRTHQESADVSSIIDASAQFGRSAGVVDADL